ncbi:response regulator [Bryocella elongata]|uniref:response regulator n=1 Tax=Bryocella elongata TaxID=863522 RepID=UPI00135C094C|nr:hypothetical protein [Bryocella elongata]
MADGSTSTRELLCTILEDNGMQVQAVCCWSCVPAAALKFSPDVILLDVSWFNAESPAMLADLRSIPQCGAVPLIALAPTALYPEPHSMAEAGFAAVLPKPITPQSLRRIVLRQLAGAA